MKKNMVRLSFDIPEDEHTMLKITCAQARLAIKDFAHAMILKGIEEFKKDEFKKRLKESIQQANDGNSRIIGSAELDKMFENAD
jgi:hypothetical protein